MNNSEQNASSELTNMLPPISGFGLQSSFTLESASAFTSVSTTVSESSEESKEVEGSRNVRRRLDESKVPDTPSFANWTAFDDHEHMKQFYPDIVIVFANSDDKFYFHRLNMVKYEPLKLLLNEVGLSESLRMLSVLRLNKEAWAIRVILQYLWCEETTHDDAFDAYIGIPTCTMTCDQLTTVILLAHEYHIKKMATICIGEVIKLKLHTPEWVERLISAGVDTHRIVTSLFDGEMNLNDPKDILLYPQTIILALSESLMKTTLTHVKHQVQLLCCMPFNTPYIAIYIDKLNKTPSALLETHIDDAMECRDGQSTIRILYRIAKILAGRIKAAKSVRGEWLSADTML